MSAFLLPLVFLLISAVVIPEAYAALKSGQLRVRGGAMVKKKERASLYWLCVFGEIIIAIVVMGLGVFGLIAAIRSHVS